MRILGLDYGSKTVGVAMSDELMITAQPLETIFREQENKLRKTYARIEEICRENEVSCIVIGLPKNMNNTEGERVEMVHSFGEDVKRRTSLPVVFWDERLTTVASEAALIEMDVRRENRKKYVDQIAAVLILQGYLDCEAMKRSKQMNEPENEVYDSTENDVSENTVLTFTDEEGNDVELEVIEETRINGVNYLLVADGEDAFIFKEVSAAEDEEAAYEPVEDEGEIEYISGIFEELLGEDFTLE